MKKIYRLAALLLSAAMLTACGGGQSAAPASAPAASQSEASATGSSDVEWPKDAVTVIAGTMKDPFSMERTLFAALRRFDELKVDRIFAEDLSKYGAGEAVMNRLLKAAGGDLLSV